MRTAIDVAVHLNDHDRLVMVVGSDRVNDFQNLLDKYNGVDGRHGYYSYSEIKVVSAGDRDPDAEGVTGMSASKMSPRLVAGITILSSWDYQKDMMVLNCSTMFVKVWVLQGRSNPSNLYQK